MSARGMPQADMQCMWWRISFGATAPLLSGWICRATLRQSALAASSESSLAKGATKPYCRAKASNTATKARLARCATDAGISLMSVGDFLKQNTHTKKNMDGPKGPNFKLMESKGDGTTCNSMGSNGDGPVLFRAGSSSNLSSCLYQEHCFLMRENHIAVRKSHTTLHRCE